MFRRYCFWLAEYRSCLLSAKRILSAVLAVDTGIARSYEMSHSNLEACNGRIRGGASVAASLPPEYVEALDNDLQNCCMTDFQMPLSIIPNRVSPVKALGALRMGASTIRIIDATLREGVQAPRTTFSRGQTSRSLSV